jgi:hypothetical protein
VAVTYDGLRENLYVDGLLVKSSTVSNLGAGTADIILGNYINGGYDYDGLLDDVRIYDGALSSALIFGLANPLTDKDPGQRQRRTTNSGGTLHAIEDICGHRHESLSKGTPFGYVVECPLHFACFDVRSGKSSKGRPST